MKPEKLSILGGGVCGLAVARGAAVRGIPFTLYEAGPHCGGNARTFEWQGFRYDSGAHRLHLRSSSATQVFHETLGPELQRVDAPSRIVSDEFQINFPLSAFDLVKELPPRILLRGMRDLALARAFPFNRTDDFETHAVRRYGRTLSRVCLLNYSEKLWGIPCRQLSQVVTGGRLRGLSMRSMFFGWLGRNPSEAAHLEGEFLYPKLGIGRLAEVFEGACPPGTIQRNTPVEKLLHDGKRICSIVVNDKQVAVDRVVSTLPLSILLRLLDPAPRSELLQAARRIQFRHVFLIALFLERERISSYATTYFPDPRLPFTRVHEPKCRGAAMSPKGRTSLVAEIPWGHQSESLNRTTIAAEVEKYLIEQGWFGASEVLGTAYHDLYNAYPVLSLEAVDTLKRVKTALRSLSNLRLLGRGASFEYLHLHDLVERAEDLLDRWSLAPDPPTGRCLTSLCPSSP